MDKYKKIKKLIEDTRIGMFTTQDGDKLYSRPIAVSQVDGDNTLWFFTDLDSEKVEEITSNRHVNFAFSNPGANEYVSFSGEAIAVKDQTKIDELWNIFLKAYFPDGKDTPSLTLVKVIPNSVEYWDDTSSSILEFYNRAKAVVTGKKYEEVSGGKNETIHYS